MSVSIAIDDVRVRLGRRDVLRGVTLDVAAGEWVNIVGPNGAGKTTLLRCAIGSIGFDGSIAVDGAVADGPMGRARTIAYVAQTPVIPPGMTVADYVLLGRTPHRGAFAGESVEDRRVATRVLTRLDLHGFATRDVRSLSGGERQRVVLARALAQSAPVLLLDEPTTALDLGHQQEVLDLVEDLRRDREITVVATLHDLTLAARYGDRVALLADGKVMAVGSPTEVLTERNIATHFDARVRVLQDADGPIIVPTVGGAPPASGQERMEPS